MSPFLQTLASYVPVLILRHRINQTDLIEPPLQNSFPAAVLFADISGFTSITERLAQQGSAGVEELSYHLNAYFGQLINLISSHGGDVIKFAGDALLASWIATDEDLTTVTHRAAQCSLELLNRLGDYAAADIRLTLHIGLSAGDITGLWIGGVQGRCEFAIAGEPIREMAQATVVASAGEVCISPQGWELISDRFSGIRMDSGFVRLEALTSYLTPRPINIPPLTNNLINWLRGFTPRGIAEHLDARQMRWLAELRCISVLFIGLPGLDHCADNVLELVQQVTTTVQKAVYQYDGTLRQVMIDDKGTVAIAAFGLPPLAHEDNAVRAVQAALKIGANLRKLGFKSAIGITTGCVYCGSVGNEIRREYAMVGDTVNLAARLMGAAQEGVLCDRTTYQATQQHIGFETCDPIRVKGKSQPLPVYRPTAQLSQVRHLTIPLVGRQQERSLLLQQLETLRQGRGGVVIVEGVPGIGKSRLIEDFIETAQKQGISLFQGAGEAMEKSTSYYAWRRIFSQLFQLDSLTSAPSESAFSAFGQIPVDEKIARHHVIAQLEKIGKEWVGFAPLLNPVLALNFSENELTQELTGQARADNTHQLLLNALQAAKDKSLQLVILEDAHWLDSASWTLAKLLATQVESILLVIVTRPLSTTAKDYIRLRSLPQSLFISLDVLPKADTLTLVCQRLGVNSLPEPVANLIRQKAQGNPFFSEELAYALRDAELIAVKNGECHLTTDEEAFSNFNIPNTIQGIITSRLDLLTPMQQLTLKIASAIGRSFFFRLLTNIYPIEEDKEHLPFYLNTLDKLDFTSLQATEPELAYLFKHQITQEVAYNLLLFSQRRQLHRAIACWYEKIYESDLSPFYPILAHHWIHAIDPKINSEEITKAIYYLDRAGEQALRAHSLREAVKFFTQALSLVEKTQKLENHDFITSKKACWERQLGEAYLGLGKLPESRDCLLNAVRLLGQPLPATKTQLILSLLRQVFSQATHRSGFIRYKGDAAKLIETARVYDLLAEVYYHANEIVLAIHAALRTLNLAEQVAPTTELARAYANSCFAAGVIPWHSLAETYRRLARSVAENLNQPLEAQARVLVLTSAYGVGVGQWERVEEGMKQAMAICDRFGDRHQWGNCQALLAKTSYFQGNFNQGIERWAELHQVAKRSEDLLHQAWGLNGQAEGLLRLGEVDQAVHLLEEALELFSQNRDRVSETATRGLLALAYLYQNKLDLAQQTARATQAELAKLSSPNSYYLIEGYAGVTEVYLNLGAAINRKLLSQACRALHQFARVFPVGQPRAWMCQGDLDWSRGYRFRAYKAWQKSVTAARRLRMPYEEGRAHHRLGKYFTGAKAQQHQDEAINFATQLGIAYRTEI